MKRITLACIVAYECELLYEHIQVNQSNRRALNVLLNWYTAMNISGDMFSTNALSSSWFCYLKAAQNKSKNVIIDSLTVAHRTGP